MRWGVLGPLWVESAAGVAVTPAGPVRRLLLAALLSRANSVVSAESLAIDVWGELPPRSAAKTLQSHLVRLRDDLGRDELATLLATEPGGYRLHVTDGELDAMRFEELVGSARRLAVHDADASLAVRAYDEALGLWRGSAYEDFPDAEFLVPERLRLAELRALAEEHRTDAALSCGLAAELVADLERRVHATPYRERLWEQLVVALYRSGRQADALGAYRRARDLLAGELGVDPGPGLQSLEARILQQDPTLMDAPRPSAESVVVDDTRCPYRGLSGYSDDDADLFVGRERLVARLAGLCADHGVVVVTGASGAGKSSLVRAGLVPALRRGALPGSSAWRSVVSSPIDVVSVVTAEPDLIVVDQAEEMFTRLDTGCRNDVAAALARHIADERRLVLVIRGDFYGRLAELASLAGSIGRATLLVGPLRDDELARVITEPAQRAGLSIEPGLVDTVLDDLAGRAGALPLVSVALVRTWDNREGGALTVAGYRAGGGVAGAVEAAAEECYQTMAPASATAARRLLVRLCGREQGIWVRRPLPREAVAGEEEAQAALDALVAARLVVVDAGSIEIAHDALLEQWPRLRAWLADREAGAELLAHLSAAARAWDAGGHSDADLYRGRRLQAAQEWCAEHPDDPTPAEAAFLTASEAAADAELHAARERADREAAGRRRLRRVAVALVAVAAVAIAGGAVALVERHTASRQAHRADAAALTADARRLAAEAVSAPDLRTALLLAAAANRLQDSPDTRSGLLAELERSGSALFRISTHERVQWVGADAAGTHLWWFDNTHQVTRFDLRSRRVDASFHVSAGDITGLSPDGRWLAATGSRAFGDDVGANRAVVVDAGTGATVAVLPSHAAGNSGLPVSFTADGRWLAVPATTAADGSAGAQIDLYDTRDFSRAARRVHLDAAVAGLAAGRTTVAALDVSGRLRLVDVATGRTRAAASLPQLATTNGDIATLGYDRDDRHLAVALPGADVVTILDTAHLSATGHSTADEGSPVGSVAFGPSGRTLAVGYQSGAVTVFGLDGTVAERTAGGSAPVRSVAWSGQATDTGLFSGGLDAAVVAWDLRQGGRLLGFDGPGLPPLDLGAANSHVFVSLSPPQGDGPEHSERLVAVDLASHDRRSWPLGITDDMSVSTISLAGDANVALVAVVLPDRRFRYDVWDLAAGRRLSSFVPTQATSVHQSFGGVVSADGRSAVVNVADRRLAVVALPSGRVQRTFDVAFPGPSGGRTLAIPETFAPDGRLFLLGFDPGPPVKDAGDNSLVTSRAVAVQQAALADVKRGRMVATTALTPLGLTNAAAWSADGTRLALGALDGNIWLLDARTLRVMSGPVTAIPDVVATMAFAPDGRTVAVTGGNGTLSLWDGHTLRPLGTTISAGPGLWPLAQFTSDGAALVGLAPTTDGQQRWFRLPARPQDWRTLACSIAGPPLTRAEWARYVGDRPYQPTC